MAGLIIMYPLETKGRNFGKLLAEAGDVDVRDALPEDADSDSRGSPGGPGQMTPNIAGVGRAGAQRPSTAGASPIAPS